MNINTGQTVVYKNKSTGTVKEGKVVGVTDKGALIGGEWCDFSSIEIQEILLDSKTQSDKDLILG